MGLKPTVGLVSRTGIIPISVSQDTAGPMAWTTEDCAILLDALAGHDPLDPASVPGPKVSYARAIEAPIRQIAENSGVEGSIVVGKILENKSETFGFDAQSEDYVDMLAKGIVDPAKVVRTALQDASSVASLLVTTEAMVAELPKEAAPAMPPGPAIPPTR